MAEVNASDLQAFVVLQHAEIEHHRKRQDNVFNMSTSIFFAVIGFMLLKSQDASCAAFLVSLQGKWLLTLLLVATAAFACKWQYYHHAAGDKHKQVIASVWERQGISELLIVGSGGTTMHPRHEGESCWGDKKVTIQHFFCSRQGATLYLGLFTILVVCLV